MEEIEKYYCKIDESLLKYCSYFDQGVVEDIPTEIFTNKQFSSLREYSVFRMGFSVVTKRNCRVLAKIIGNSNVLEIMCGLGAYTATLRQLGIHVIPTDDMSWIDYDTSKYKNWKKYAWVKDIQSLDAVEAIRKYGKSVGFIIMSWPPQNEDFALNALMEMRRVNTSCRMIYVGEKRGGCTANDAFFDEIDDVSEKYKEISDLRNTYRYWANNEYFDSQFIVR